MAAPAPAAAAAPAGTALAGPPPAPSAPRGPAGRKSRSGLVQAPLAGACGATGFACAGHPLASAASFRSHPAQGNPDESSFLAPRAARGTPAAASCGSPARRPCPGTWRWPASTAPAGPAARMAGSSDCPGHSGGRCTPPPCIAHT